VEPSVRGFVHPVGEVTNAPVIVGEEQTLNPFRYRFDRFTGREPVNEGFTSEVTPETNVEAFVFTFGIPVGLAPEAYVGDLGLCTGGRATAQMHSHHLWRIFEVGRCPFVKVAGPPKRTRLRLDEPVATELSSGTGQDPPREGTGIGAISRAKGFRPEVRHRRLRNMWQKDVLVQRQPNFVSAVVLGNTGDAFAVAEAFGDGDDTDSRPGDPCVTSKDTVRTDDT